MAMQLSNYLWMANNYLRPIIRDEPGPYRELRVTPADRRTLSDIVAQIDKLHECSDTVTEPRLVLAVHVAVPVGMTIIERSSNPAQSGALFEQLFQIIARYDFSPDIYRRLGGAYEELGIKPPIKSALAIEYGIWAYAQHRGPTSKLNWNREKECIGNNFRARMPGLQKALAERAMARAHGAESSV